MKAPTYNLRPFQPDSHEYYPLVARLTDEVLAHGHEQLLSQQLAWMAYVQRSGAESLRHPSEYLFDLLMFGVFWRQYGPQALALGPVSRALLSALFWLRSRARPVKPAVDWIRGVLSTLLLTSTEKAPSYPSLSHIQKLLGWMTASGEFKQEVKRLELLADFLATLPEHKRFAFTHQLVVFAQWFELRSPRYLGQFTDRVDSFIQRTQAQYRFREDVLFAQRRPIEYQLNMCGAEILNRAYRSAFQKSKRKALLVPACMRTEPSKGCQARQNGLDRLCTGCNPRCRVHQLSRLGEKKGFETHIIPHSSDFSRWLKEFAVQKDVGVVGVACVLQLIGGGLELRALDIPAQCVLLDYCGCRQHWDRKGIPTDINQAELLHLLQPAKTPQATSQASKPVRRLPVLTLS